LSISRPLAILVLTLASACAAPPAPLPPRPQPILDPDSACLRDLRDRRVAFEPQAAIGAGGCSIANPVKVSGGASMGWNRPGVVSCAMARTVETFEAQVVAPIAQRVLGQRVVRLVHMGTYDCRNRRTETSVAAAARGEGSRGGRLSEHSRGQAIDIGGFELADGSIVSVKKDWKGAGKRSEFLQQVARASCDHFNVVLTPNHNRLHADHLHLDIGPHRLCGY